MEREILIDLKEHIAPGVRALNTRTLGIALRNSSKIDVLEPIFDRIQIKIPREISSINSVFFEELLENVVHKLGTARFHHKFLFISDGNYSDDKISAYVNEAVINLTRYEAV